MSTSSSSTNMSNAEGSPRTKELDDDEEWDEEEEDEMIIELREVWRQSTATVSLLEESGDSLDGEDTEQIKTKLRLLREYVNDLQASYDELLTTFGQLENAARERMGTLENKLSTALSCAKEFQDRCTNLESQIDELKKNNIPGYNEAQQIEALEDDLSSVLQAITEGIESGVLKLSELRLSTQDTPLPLQDIVLNHAPPESISIEPSDTGGVYEWPLGIGSGNKPMKPDENTKVGQDVDPYVSTTESTGETSFGHDDLILQDNAHHLTPTHYTSIPVNLLTELNECVTPGEDYTSSEPQAKNNQQYSNVIPSDNTENRENETNQRDNVINTSTVFQQTKSTIESLKQLPHSPVSTDRDRLTHSPVSTDRDHLTHSPVSTDRDHLTHSPVSTDRDRLTHSPVSTDRDRLTHSPVSTDRDRLTHSPVSTDRDRLTHSPVSTDRDRLTHSPVSTDRDRLTYSPVSTDKDRLTHTPVSTDRDHLSHSPAHSDKDHLTHGLINTDRDRLTHSPVSTDKDRLTHSPVSTDRDRLTHSPVSTDRDRLTHSPVSTDRDRLTHSPVSTDRDHLTHSPAHSDKDHLTRSLINTDKDRHTTHSTLDQRNIVDKGLAHSTSIINDLSWQHTSTSAEEQSTGYHGNISYHTLEIEELQTSGGEEQGTCVSSPYSKEKWNEDLNDDSILTQLLERDCHIAELETRIQDLEHQLQEAEHSHLSTQSALTEAQNAMRNYQWSAVSKQEDKMKHVLAEVDQLTTDQNKLEQQIEEERKKVRELELARDTALSEVEMLHQQITSLSTVHNEPVKEFTTEELKAHHAVVKTQLALQDVRLQSLSDESDTLLHQRQTLQQQCQEVEGQVNLLQGALRSAQHETHRLQATSAGKEAELKRLLTAINTTRAQLSSLHKTSHPMEESSANDVNNENEQAVQGLERDVVYLKKQWEELCMELGNHEAAIATLTGRELTLASELDQREARILELEALLQALEIAGDSRGRSLTRSQVSLDILRADLSKTRDDYHTTCDQMKEMHRKLQKAVVSLVGQLELFKAEVCDRNERIAQLEKEQEELWSLYHQTNYCLKEEEALKEERENRLQVLEEELVMARKNVEEMEALLEADNQSRLNDLEYQKAVLLDLCHQLGSTDLTMTQPTSLQAKLTQRDQLLQNLQDQTSQLLENHTVALQEVERRQKLVKELESNIVSSSAVCDTLEKEVAEGHNKLATIQRQLVDSEQEKADIEQQLVKLQKESEEVCRSLESALRKNSLLRQQNEDTMSALQAQLDAERSVHVQLETRVRELVSGVQEREEEVKDLRSTVSDLEFENTRLLADKSHSDTVLSSLHEQLDEDSNKYQTMREELGESLKLIEELKSQLSHASVKQDVTQSIADERLQEVSTLQEQLQQAITHTTRLEDELKVARVGERNLENSYSNKIITLEETTSTLKTLYETKCVELEQLKLDHQLLIEKDSLISQQLEECHKELDICKQRATQLDSQYQNTLQELNHAQSELKSFQESRHNNERDTNRKRMRVLNEKVTLLETQLTDSHQRLQQTEDSLHSTEEEKRKLLQKLSALEEHYNTLIRNHSQLKLLLSRSQNQYEKQHKRYTSLQSEYDQMAEQISEWAESHRSSSEALVKNIKEQEKEINSLKCKQQLLKNENETLREQLQDKAQTSSGNSQGANSLDSTLRKLELQYQQTLEKGISSTSGLDTSGYSSPAESSDDLDKAYWIRRAGELSVQLQESSEYWSAKVREQSLKLEKFENHHC